MSNPSNTSSKKSQKRLARTSIAIESSNSIGLAAPRSAGGPLGDPLGGPFAHHVATWGPWGCFVGSLGVLMVIFWGHLGALWGVWGGS